MEQVECLPFNPTRENFDRRRPEELHLLHPRSITSAIGCSYGSVQVASQWQVPKTGLPISFYRGLQQGIYGTKSQSAHAGFQGSGGVGHGQGRPDGHKELASQFGVPPTLVHAWKKQFLVQVAMIFPGLGQDQQHCQRGHPGRAVEQFGWLKMDWSGSKELQLSADCKRALVEPAHGELSVRLQYELLGLNRSSLHYEPASTSPEENA